MGRRIRRTERNRERGINGKNVGEGKEKAGRNKKQEEKYMGTYKGGCNINLDEVFQRCS